MTEQQRPDWAPAFPGQRPPFAPGNTLAVTHGAESPTLYQPRAAEIVQALRATLPAYLSEPSYAPALAAYATTLARIERLEVWLAQTAMAGTPEELGEDGQVRGATNLLLRLEATADRQRTQLGLTPLSRARLGKDVAKGQQSLAEAMAAYGDRQDREDARGGSQSPQGVSEGTERLFDRERPVFERSGGDEG